MAIRRWTGVSNEEDKGERVYLSNFSTERMRHKANFEQSLTILN